MGLPIQFSEGGGGEGQASVQTSCLCCKKAYKPWVLKLSQRFNTKEWNTIQLWAYANSGGPTGTILGLLTLPGPHSWSMHTGHGESLRNTRTRDICIGSGTPHPGPWLVLRYKDGQSTCTDLQETIYIFFSDLYYTTATSLPYRLLFSRESHFT